MRSWLPIALVASMALFGCSSEDGPENGGLPPVGPDEVVAAPTRPGGPTFLQPGVEYTFTSGSAVSSEGHPVEYRFDFDAQGAHDYTPWSRSSLVRKSWPAAGSHTVVAEARCELHPTVVSEVSLAKIVEVGLGPATDVTAVVSRYYIGNNEFTESIDFTDGVPDTVPFNSWVTLFYTGTPSPVGAQECGDTLNKCLRFQFQYTCESVFQPNKTFTDTWRPFSGEDNVDGTSDSTTVNIGSYEYTLRVRAFDLFDRRTPNPPEIEIVGNFDPTLESLAIEDVDGRTIADGDTITWDWLNPSNSPDTLDLSGGDLYVVRKFHFWIRGRGYDHPKEPAGSGVKRWIYTFLNRGVTPPESETLYRSGVLLDGTTVNQFDERVEVTFRYKLADDPGGHITRANTSFLDRELECAIQGRDLASNANFQQKVVLDGALVMLNDINTAATARRTATLSQRLFIKIVE